ncbi:germinal-center associated nuclear protein isoform X2 [Cyprinodon tularosa]|uniref:germinal-center associated nuclear protein isoform X2 n=1 Tax=Cyprinodon tularosa TaxID=77115 RepID=UPI0018E1EC0B|nr:germinal-center associated nuclear protein isoform X2 [Cyprinodon tularosa]
MNPFGSPQGGAFQAPGSSMKPSLFQVFGQQNSSGSQGQSFGFQQPPAFGQPSATHQSAAQGGSIFGQQSVVNQPATQGGSIFGQGSALNQPAAKGGPLFGQQSVVNQPAAQGGFIFGQQSSINQPAVQSGSIFGQPSTANQTAAQSGSIFGQQLTGSQPTAQSGSIFGQPSIGSQPTAQSGSIFGQQSTGSQPTAQSGSIFGQPSIGSQPTAQSGSIFGQPSTGSQPTAQSGSIFGQPSTGSQPTAQSGSIFGQPSTGSQPMAQSGSIFGQQSTGSQPTAQSGSIFGQQSTGSRPTAQSGSIFGQQSTGSQPTAQSGSIFGQPSIGSQPTAQSGSIFGQPSTGSQPRAQNVSIFGQQSTVNQPTSQSGSIFGQPSTVNQPTSQSGSIFGQPSTANQPTSQSGSIFGQPSTVNQPTSQSGSIFGQPSTANQSTSQSGSIFGQQSTVNQPTSQSVSIFGQPSPMNQPGAQSNSIFGQLQTQAQPSMSQVPSFGETSGFGKPPPAFGSSHIIITSSSGQTSSGQTASSNVFSAAQNVNQNQGFGRQDFSFKPPTESVFKPIFSSSPELGNNQTLTTSSSSFGGSSSQRGSSSTAFSALTGAKSGPTGFSFTQPAATSSVSNQPTTANSNQGSSTPHFTFTKPAALPGSSSTGPTTEPTTPSSFNFTASALQTQPTQFSSNVTFSQTPSFGGIHPKAEFSTDGKEGGTNVFGRLGKAIKRKDDPAASSSGFEKPAAEEDAPANIDSPRHPAKRQVTRSRGPAGLFGQALSGIRKNQGNPVKREAANEALRQNPNLEEEEKPQGNDPSALPPTAQIPTRDAVGKPERSDTVVPPSSVAEALTPVSQGARRDSLDSLSGLSPSDLTTIMCRNIPPSLNKKDVIEKHFARFGKVCKIFCRPNKNLAIVHFEDHVSAAKAKRRGKVLHGEELLLLWQKKKQSPGDKSSRSPPEKDKFAGESPKVEEPKPGSSPLRRPTLMPPTVSSHLTFRQSSPLRPSPSKQPLFDPEPQKENLTEPQSSERNVPSSLSHLIGQFAETAEERYRILEQRDKVLRQERPKRTDLDLSRVFVGTCPDMCPEKERYMRETRNQLSVFEVLPNTEMVDHEAAIKEYSRSSADQEEPLPHELRPLPVLRMTMDYLVTQIMDQAQDNLRDWYDFVWNRTRGIRKDIIQQRLCCPDTVALIEKCTRFHVHCAHHLCEERLSSFDAKINNENMTKCMQSLKEMYEDLATQQTFCPREAEFRQYSVLLKLNDGDILREVQQFRDEVRKSPEVKFAVQAFAAVSSNNFVRFFKLVKRASYLSGCLLHRYFNQVRSRALKTLNWAHTVGPRSTPFPVDDIVRMLMFRSAAEATDFIQQYGLNVNDGMVELSRTSFQEPELPLSLKRSDVILAKKAALIGQVVNGGPLPNPPRHTPVCSFDSQSKFRGDGVLTEPSFSSIRADAVEVSSPPRTEVPTQFALIKALDAPTAAAERGESFQPAAQLFQPIPQPELIKPPSPAPKPQPVYSEEDIMAEVDAVIEEVVGAEVRAVADGGASYAKAALMESSVQVEALVGEVSEQMLKEISATEIKLEQERLAEEKRRLEEARRRQEHEAFLMQFSGSLCTEIIHEVVDEAVKEAATSEIQEALKEKAVRFAKCTEQIWSSLIEETLNSDMAQLAEEVLEAEKELIRKFIKRWREVVAVRRQLKRQMRSFPAAPCCVDPHFKLRALAPSAPARPSMADLARGLVNLGNGGLLAVSSTRLLEMRRSAVHQMRVHFYYQQLLEEKSWKPLDLPALATENAPASIDRIFWKALLLLPSDQECKVSPADRILSDWLEVKLGRDPECEEEEETDGSLKTLCVSNSLQEKGEGTYKVHITVKASRGPLTTAGLSGAEEFCELHGTRAIIMLLPGQPLVEPEQEEQDVPLLSALLQLKQLQQINSWNCPLPLVILVPWPHSDADAQRLEEALKLHALIKEELISEFLLVFIPDSTSDLQGSEQLTQAVRWLLGRSPPAPPLSCRTLVQLIEASLSQEFCPRVYSNRQNRAAVKLPWQEAAPVVHLYNAVLAHVADRVCSRNLSDLSWPPAEFSQPETREFIPYLGWNSEQHLSWLRAVILSLLLPEWEEIPAADSWSDICSSIFRYASKIPASRHSQPLLMSRLENLLEKVRLKAQLPQPNRSRLTGGNMDLEESRVCSAFRLIPWDDVVLIFIDHKLKDWHPPGPPACPDAVTEDGEILVYFPTGSLEGFRPPAEWAQAVEKTHLEKQLERDRVTQPSCTPPPAPFFRQKLFCSLVEAPETPRAPLDITHTPTAEELLAHKVLQSLEEEKVESKRSLEQLQRWLDGDPLDQLSTPLFIPSSTLLSSPTMKASPSGRREAAAATQDLQRPELDEHVDRPSWSKPPRVPLAQRLKDLERQVLASREEELAWRFKLSGLLSIVDD